MFTAMEIKRLLSEIPFVPLRFIMSSGQSYDIVHPELVLISNRTLCLGVPSNEFSTSVSVASHVAMMHITDLQVVPQRIQTGSNGTI